MYDANKLLAIALGKNLGNGVLIIYKCRCFYVQRIGGKEKNIYTVDPNRELL